MINYVELRDSECLGTLGQFPVIYWKSYINTDNQISLPKYLESNAEEIRKIYCDMISDVANDDKLLSDLSVDSHFSMWWMGLIYEKNPFKSSEIYDCLLLIALEKLLIEKSVKNIKLHTTDRILKKSLGRLCQSLNIRIDPLCSVTSKKNNLSVRQIYDSLPNILKALMYFRHIYRRFALKKIDNKKWFNGNDSIFIDSFFIHLNLDSCNEGRYSSKLWGNLPSLIKSRGFKVNWLHKFLVGNGHESEAKGVLILNKLNDDSERKKSVHKFIYSFLDLGIIAKVLLKYIHLYFKVNKINIGNRFVPAGMNCNLWFFLENVWNNSFRGSVGLENLFLLELYGKILKEIPYQKIGLYLYENQPWERALIYSWRKYGHGEIYGVQHSTVPFWHLYYMSNLDGWSEESFSTKNPYMPSMIVANSHDNYQALAKQNHPPTRLVIAEALRYQKSNLQILRSRNYGNDRTKIIILGDMLPSNMHDLLSGAKALRNFFGNSIDIKIKSHPGLLYDINIYGFNSSHLVEGNLQDLLVEFDVAISANSTSASLEAHQLGLTTLVMINPEVLNLSPLKGSSSAIFIENNTQLIKAISNRSKLGVKVLDNRNSFLQGSGNLDLWSDLLGLTNNF